MSVDITDQGYTVVVEEESNEVTVVAPGAAGALGYYGSFFSDQDQHASTINTNTLMTLNNTAEANGVSIVSNSQITFAYDGTYDLQFSAQLHHRGGGGNGTEIDIWLVKNGTPVPDTATKLIIPKNSYEVAAWDFLLTLAAGDYLELAYRTTNTDIYIEHAVADGVPVDTPSLIVTVMQVMYNQVGPQGPTGPAGTAATIAVGTTTTLDPGDPATVTNSGTSSAAVFDFGIPEGEKGDKGDQGDPGTAATVAVGTVTTLDPGDPATVTNSGTSTAAIFDFGIPEGDKGDKGDTGDTGPQGPQGPQGDPGAAATITAGTTTTLSAGSSATVTNSGSSSAAVFDFGIPQGIKGDTGDTGPAGPAGADGATVLELQVFS